MELTIDKLQSHRSYVRLVIVKCRIAREFRDWALFHDVLPFSLSATLRTVTL